MWISRASALCLLKRGQDGVPTTRGRLISILCSMDHDLLTKYNGVGPLPVGLGYRIQ